MHSVSKLQHIIIYESSSFGGCYEYALQLQKHYKKHVDVLSCQLLLPKNAKVSGDEIKLILLDDAKKELKILSRFSFIYRHLVNPLLLVFYLRNQPASFVLLNDFEQLSAWIWVPLMRFWASQHTFGVFLHDPDRDDYPPSEKISAASMRKMLSIMDLALYHEVLPDRTYYQNSATKFISVPHGLYDLPERDLTLHKELASQIPNGSDIMLLLGAIRPEKNYHLAIEALAQIDKLLLIIAGQPANSHVDVEALKKLSRELKVFNRIIWIDRFLSYAEMVSCIEVSTIVWLNYSASFKSQSAIFNTVAAAKKRVIVADGESAMAVLVRKFDLGVLVQPDSLADSIVGLKQLLSGQEKIWQDYLDYASWDKQVDMVVHWLNDRK